MRTKHIPLLALAILSIAPSRLHGAILAEWNTTGFTGSETSITSTNVPSGLLVTAVGIGSELSTTAGAGGMNTVSWSTALNATTGNYYGFSMTVAANYEVSLTTWNFTARSSNSGPGNFSVRYSGDSFASNIDTFSTTNDLYGNVSIDLSSLGTLNSGTYEFRVGLLDDTQSDGVGVVSTVGTHRIMNIDSSGTTVGATPVNLNGTITSVPEPAAALLGSFGMIGLLRRRR